MNDIENGVKELYKIFKENCYLQNHEFADMVVREVGIESKNKNLELICQSIVDTLREQKK